jgi:hypothetical protein
VTNIKFCIFLLDWKCNGGIPGNSSSI